MTKQDGSVVLTESYTYKTHNGYPTTQVASVEVRKGSDATLYRYEYTYDANGNITAVRDALKQTETTYTYDSANQLIRENNRDAGKTWTWTYDSAGNILEKKEYAYTTGALGAVLDTVGYTYGDSQWGDLLTAYDGQALSYDNIGNLTNDGTWTYTWEHGRQLASMTGNGATWTYTYDADGMRTGRTNGSKTYSYVYNGGQLTQMTVDGEAVTFGYDASGNPQTMTWQGSTYYYLTNLQGDVIGIANGSGTRLVYYYYTAYGTASVSMNSNYTSLATSLIAANPLTYRGYVYDQGTSLYYLQSRYYNPNTGRFLNADALVATGQGMLGNNMFAYCGNNPITRVDFSGTAYTMTCFEIDRIPRKIPNPPSDYIESFRSDQNCYSYAFGLDGDYDPGELSGHGKMYQRGKQFYTNEELIVLIQSDIDAGYIDARKIDDPYDLNEDEYLVAMKTSTFLLPNKKHSDYHFAMLLSDGSWADKPGRADSRWNRIDGFASTWDLYGQNGYYNTDTVYFAVKKR